jgi:hypothetical protein
MRALAYPLAIEMLDHLIRRDSSWREQLKAALAAVPLVTIERSPAIQQNFAALARLIRDPYFNSLIGIESLTDNQVIELREWISMVDDAADQIQQQENQTARSRYSAKSLVQEADLHVPRTPIHGRKESIQSWIKEHFGKTVPVETIKSELSKLRSLKRV